MLAVKQIQRYCMISLRDVSKLIVEINFEICNNIYQGCVRAILVRYYLSKIAQLKVKQYCSIDNQAIFTQILESIFETIFEPCCNDFFNVLKPNWHFNCGLFESHCHRLCDQQIHLTSSLRVKKKFTSVHTVQTSDNNPISIHSIDYTTNNNDINTNATTYPYQPATTNINTNIQHTTASINTQTMNHVRNSHYKYKKL